MNAFIVDKFDPVLFGEKIDFIFNEKSLSQIIAKNAYALGRAKFHYKSISDNLYNFIENL